jgi:hypothetical protein
MKRVLIPGDPDWWMEVSDFSDYVCFSYKDETAPQIKNEVGIPVSKFYIRRCPIVKRPDGTFTIQNTEPSE